MYVCKYGLYEHIYLSLCLSIYLSIYTCIHNIALHYATIHYIAVHYINIHVCVCFTSIGRSTSKLNKHIRMSAGHSFRNSMRIS